MQIIVSQLILKENIMSLFKEIKDAGLDIFIQYHPKVIALKREARKLHKQEKKKSLMQYQEQVAKENGFNNWHHLITLIKKNYNDEKPEIYEKHRYFFTTKTLEEKNEDCVLCLGHDVNIDNYKWQSIANVRSHQLILTPNYEEYSLFLMKQIIKQQKKLMVINPNKKTLNELIQYAETHQLKQDIKIINFSSELFAPQYTAFLNNDWNIDSEHLSHILMNLSKTVYAQEDWVKGRIAAKLLSLTFIAQYMSEKNKETWSIAYLKSFLAKEKILEIKNEYNEITDISLSEKYKACINTLLEYTDEEHAKLDQVMKKMIHQILDICEYHQVYKNNGIGWNELLNQKEDIIIFYFGELSEQHKKEQSHLILNIIRNNISEILTGFNSKTKVIKEGQYLFVLNSYIPQNMGIIPAQARGMCLSLNIGFSSLKDMEEHCESKEEVSCLNANTLTKILSFQEKKKLFEGSSEENKNSINNDILWIVKGFHEIKECQIEFKDLNI